MLNGKEGNMKRCEQEGGQRYVRKNFPSDTEFTAGIFTIGCACEYNTTVGKYNLSYLKWLVPFRVATFCALFQLMFH